MGTEVKFKNVVTLHRGYDLPKRLRIEGKYPVVSSGGLNGSHREYKVEGPGVVVGREGSAGTVQWEQGNYWPLNTTLYVSDFHGNDPRFVYYMLLAMDLKKYATGTTVPSLNRNHLDNIDVMLPSLNTQLQIVYILDSLDDKIELNQQINSNLLKLINVMFHKNYLADKRIKVSKAVKLSSIVRTKSNTFNPKKTSETLINHFSMPAFDVNRFPVVDVTSDIKSNKNVVEPFSILVSKMNPSVKRVWLPNTSKDLLNVASTEFLTFNADVPEMQAFVYSVVNDKRYQMYLEANTTGSTNSRQRVLPKVAYSYEIPYVKEVAQQFGFQIVDIINMIKLNKEQNQCLTRLRNILLPKLLAGDIDLSNIGTVMNNA